MCWIGKETDRHIAKEDVKVFKVLYTKLNVPRGFSRDFLAPYFRFCYYLDRVYESEVDVTKPLAVIPPLTPWKNNNESMGKRNIHKALHCYSYEMCSWIRTDIYTVTICKGAGKHIDRPIAHYPLQYNKIYEEPHRVAAIVECIIPAGTEYWLNDKGEIATSKLILREIKEIF